MGTDKNKSTDEGRSAPTLKRLVSDNAVLHLTLKKRPFEVMVTGEKNIEVREPSDWILSRLQGKDYDVVKFVNGYGAERPFFIAEYLTYYPAMKDTVHQYSNGLLVPVNRGDYIIHLGEVLHKGSIKALH